MSILIRGMEMPEHCFNCSTKIDPDNRRCNIDGHIFEETLSKLTCRRDEACPLVELPPHGDLISRDEAVSVLQSIGSRDYRREKGTICDAIKMISHSQYVPTIVPASEEATNDPKP